MYTAKEADIERTVRDFDAFCSYLEQKRPKLTKSRRELGKKDCYEINVLMSRPREVDGPKYLQPVYLTVNLFFHIALETGVFIQAPGRNGDIHLVPGPKLRIYKDLNLFSKYMFLFRSYWTWLDYSALYFDNAALLGHFIDTRIGFEALKKKKPGERVFADIEDFNNYSAGNPVHRFFVCAGAVIFHLRDFGFWECEEAFIKQKVLAGKNDPNVKAVTPSAFGLAMIRACLERPYEVYNEKPDALIMEKAWADEYLAPVLKELGIEKAVAAIKKEPFEKAFEGIFPAKALDLAAINAMFGNSDRPVDIGGNVYIFKVTYKRGVWRRIRLSSAHTLHHLHEAIQEAYDFDDDHLYAFFMDGKPWTGKTYWSPHSDGPPYADKTLTGMLGLKRGQRFLYLFDFGDEWNFNVQVDKILQSDMPPVRPAIIESCGEAPEQYPDMFWEDEDGEE